MAKPAIGIVVLVLATLLSGVAIGKVVMAVAMVVAMGMAVVTMPRAWRRPPAFRRPSRGALPAGGVIRLEVARVRRSQVELPPELQSASTDYVRLRVADNGVGIPRRLRSHLFEPFFTTKEVGKGTGLGLASVYGIVRQSNGFISRRDEPGKGTVFTMHFPAVSRPSSSEPRRPRLRPSSRRRRDHPARRRRRCGPGHRGEILRRQGYHVLEAASPAAAQRYVRPSLRRHRPAADRCRHARDGWTCTGPAAGRPEARTCRAVHVGHAEMATPLDAGNPSVGFLRKPFQSAAWRARSRRCCRAPAARDTSSAPASGGVTQGL